MKVGGETPRKEQDRGKRMGKAGERKGRTLKKENSRGEALPKKKGIRARKDWGTQGL